MDILELIKKRRTIRKYKDTPVSQKNIMQIIDAGMCASSVHGFQPWRFIVNTNHGIAEEISNILLRKAKKSRSSSTQMMSLTANTIANAPLLILIYNQNIFKSVASKFYKLNALIISKHEAASGIGIAERSEIEAISGAIQNMILVADALGIGSCWNTVPLFCEREINRLLNNDEQLIAILTMGYPAEKGRRSKRKSRDQIVQFIH